ncbi:MAG: hypothetical protein IJE98_04640 [Oscillospiraceae bacterium]|nr:hypothetical protein [Oscillospiraceae bacterium]
MEIINRCKTCSTTLIVGLICQIFYTVCYLVILLGQGFLRAVFYGAAQRPNVYPVVDTVLLMGHLVLYLLLFFFVWHKATDATTRFPEMLAVVVCGLLLTGLPFSANMISNMLYGNQGSEVLISYSLFTAMTGFIRPLSRLAQVLMLVGAMGSIGNKRAQCACRQ